MLVKTKKRTVEMQKNTPLARKGHFIKNSHEEFLGDVIKSLLNIELGFEIGVNKLISN